MTAVDEYDGFLAARLSIYLNVLVNPGGMAHPLRDYQSWLKQVGYRSVGSYPARPHEHGLVVDTKA